MGTFEPSPSEGLAAPDTALVADLAWALSQTGPDGFTLQRLAAHTGRSIAELVAVFGSRDGMMVAIGDYAAQTALASNVGDDEQPANPVEGLYLLLADLVDAYEALGSGSVAAFRAGPLGSHGESPVRDALLSGLADLGWPTNPATVDGYLMLIAYVAGWLQGESEARLREESRELRERRRQLDGLAGAATRYWRLGGLVDRAADVRQERHLELLHGVLAAVTEGPA